jgi:hypothetical protein
LRVFLIIHSAAHVIRNLMRLSTGLCTSYPQDGGG